MSTDIATLAVAVDTRSVRVAVVDLDKLAQSGAKAEKEISALELSNAQLARSLDSALAPMRMMRDLLAALGLAASVAQIIRMSDGFQTLQARIRTATSATNDYAKVSQELFAVSQRTGSMLEVNVGLFQSLSRVGPQLGATNTQILKLVEVSQQLGVIGGAGAEEMANGMRQFAQAMGSGALRGDELNSILENLPELANRIAKGLGVTVGQLRDLGAAGKLTGREITEGLLKQAAEIETQFNAMPLSISRAGTMMENAFQKVVGDTDSSMKGTQTLAQGMKLLADNMAFVVDKTLLLAAAVGTVYAAQAIGPAIAAGATWLQQQIALNAALEAGTASAIAGAAASLSAAQAAAAETNATYLTAQANLEFTTSELAVTRAEIALEQVRKEAQINNVGRLAIQREIMALRQIEAQQIQTLAAQETALGAATAANATAMAGAAAATQANAVAIQSTTLAARAAAGAMTALKAVMSFFGGPVGLAITALTLGIGLLATRQTAAQKAASQHTEAMAAFNRVIEAATGQIKTQNDELAKNARLRAEADIATQRNVLAQARSTGGMVASGTLTSRAIDATGGFFSTQSARDSLPGLSAAREAVEQFQAGSLSAVGFENSLLELAKSSDVVGAALTNQNLKDYIANAKAAEDAIKADEAALKALGDAVPGDAMSKLSTTVASLKVALGAAAQSLDMVITPAGILSNSQVDLAKHTKALNEILALSPDKLKEMGVGAEDVARVLTLVQQKLDPVTAAIKAMNDETTLLKIPAGLQRDIASTQMKAKDSNMGVLSDQQAGDVATAVISKNLAALKDHNRELEQQARLQQLVAAAAGGNAQAQAAAQRQVELYNQALKIGGVAAGEMVLNGEKLPPMLQQTADALKANDLAKFGAEAAKAATDLRMQAEAQERLAGAAGVSSIAMSQMEVHNKAVSMAFEKGVGSVEAWEKALRRVYEAEQQTKRNEWVRQIQEQVAANDNLTKAYLVGSDAAIKAAERENAIADAMRQYGITAEDAAVQVDKLRASQNALNIAKQTDQFRQQADVIYALNRAMEEAAKTGNPLATRNASRNTVDKFVGGGDRMTEIRAQESAARQMDNYKALRDAGVLTAEEQKAAYGDAYDAMLKASTDWEDGAELAFRDYARAASNGAKQAYTFINNTMSSLEDSIVKTVKSGEVSFTDFFDAINEGLIRMAAQLLIIEPIINGIKSSLSSSGISWSSVIGSIGSVVGSVFGSGSAASSLGDFGSVATSAGTMVAHIGGIAGMGTGISRNIDPMIFMGAERFHTGGIPGLGAGEVPIIAKWDEEVLTRQDPRHRWNGGGAANSNGGGAEVNVFDYRTVKSEDDQTKVERSTGDDGMERINVLIGDTVEKQLNNGRYDKAFQSNYGAARAGKKRA